MDLNNENKHVRLTPQTRQEERVTRAGSSRAESSCYVSGEGRMVIEGSGCIGGLILPGDQCVTVDQSAVTYGPGTQTVITWISAHFR